MQASTRKSLSVANHELAQYYFHQGSTVRAYDYLGVHFENGMYAFRVWAPRAQSVSVVGDFNNWNRGAAPMHKVTGGIWETLIEKDSIRQGQNYKFCIRANGKEFLKADPYAFSAQCPPDTASVLCESEGYVWRDRGWMSYRAEHFRFGEAARRPINIYEMHLPSWKRRADGSYPTYTELAAEAVHYVKQMGYTHIELMPVFERDQEDRPCAFYAPFARFGMPRDFMAFVDTMHEAGIGVILQWSPTRFSAAAHSLCEFDGQPLYESPAPVLAETMNSSTRLFDLEREEVQSFLISCSAFWAEKYHIDGFCIDGIEGMRSPTQDCLYPAAAAFLRKLNAAMKEHYPSVMMIARVSSARPSAPMMDGDLGFAFWWNTNWTHNALSYIGQAPLWREAHHNLLTFPLSYAFDRAFVLPLPHEEAAAPNPSFLDRNPGEYGQKFAGYRAFLTYMMTIPGKKLGFMGYEFGQFRAWDPNSALEWFLLDYDMHAHTQLFVAELNHFYLSHPTLWEGDSSRESFRWLDTNDRAQKILAYERVCSNGDTLTVAINFSSASYDDIFLSVPDAGHYRLLFSTDESRYGGAGSTSAELLPSVPTDSADTYPNALRLSLPPLTAVILERVFEENAQ